MDGFSSGNKMASGVFNKRKHAYEFTPFGDIVQLRRDEVHRNVILLVVRLGPLQYEIFAFRIKEEREAKSIENTFKYILNIIDVENGGATRRSIWDYKSKMMSGESFDNLTPFSQELWGPPPSSENTESTLDLPPMATKPFLNYPGTPHLSSRPWDNFEFLRHEKERAKDDTFVRYMSNGYQRSDTKPLNSRAYSVHHKRMFHSQDIKAGLSSRAWFVRDSGVQTDFRTPLSYGISKSPDVVPPKLHFRQAKLYVINGRPVTDIACQVMTEQTIPKMPAVSYVIKPVTQTQIFSNQNIPRLVQDSYNIWASQQEKKEQKEKVATTTIATQTSFVVEETSSQSEFRNIASSESIRKQVSELSEEVKHLRQLIELTKQEGGQHKQAPIGAHITRDLPPESRRSAKQTSQATTAGHMVWRTQTPKRNAPPPSHPPPTDPPAPKSPPSGDSAYCESEVESVEVPRPLYSSTPREPLKLKRSNSFRVPRRSGIPVMKSQAANQHEPTKSRDTVIKSSEARPLGPNAQFSYLRTASLQVVDDRHDNNPKRQPMRATKPHQIFDSRNYRDPTPVARSRDGTPREDLKRPHITRIPVSGVYNASRRTRSNDRAAEKPGQVARHRSQSPNMRKLMYTGSGSKPANITERLSRSRGKVYLPQSNGP